MAENQDGQEKSEPASGKRLDEARQRGQVSKSQDVTTASVLLFGGLAVYILGQNTVVQLKEFMKYVFYNISYFDLTDQNSNELFYEFVKFLGLGLVPLLVAMFMIILATEIGQVGFTFATKKFTEGLQFKKIFNPFSGIKKIFISGRSFFELVKSLTKVVLLGLVVYWVLATRMDEAVGLIERPFDEIVAFLVSVSFELLYKVAGFFIIIAVADWMYQRYRYREDMKMTKQEVKEEGKQSEGDPKIKARIRQLMRQRIRKLMLKNVQTADVVITNPTHFAVALKYTPGKMSAPQVKAKGLDFLALQIREIAQKNGVPIVEEPPLARTLFFTVDVDQEIPENLFKAVAQILAYVYKLKKKAV